MRTTIILLLLYIIVPSSVYAKTITASGTTLEETESKIRQLTEKEGAKQYKIIEARSGNKVHITAKTTP